jgi:branched-chain amino acid transport system ATP-binding protein
MTIALSLSNVQKRFGPVAIIRGVTLDVPVGERHAIIGPNGAGKSTLFNLISGRMPVSAGTIRLNGENIEGRQPFEINRRGLSRSFQITNIFPNLSVYENLRCATLWACGHGYSFWSFIDRLKDVKERTETVMEDIGMTALRDARAGVLTYAEQRALEIGLTIAGGAKVILLDEPMAGMSLAETERALALIRRVTADRTLLMIEHDMNVVFGIADRISVLVYGEILATDTPARIRENAAVQEAYLGQATE